MSEIKDILQSVYNIICTDILSSPYNFPEVTRKAKFDKVEKEEVNVLWRVLALLLQFRNGGYFKIDILDEVKTKKGGCQLLIKEVTKILHDLNYQRTNFSNPSGREVLLAIGWVLAKFKSLDTYVMFKINYWEDYGNIFEVPVALLSTERESKGNNSGVHTPEEVQKLLWLIGKLKYSIGSLIQQHEGLAKIKTKANVLNGLSISSSSSLSILNSSSLEKSKLETEIRAYQGYENWKKYEHIFWQWMQTVLALADGMVQDGDSQNIETDQDKITEEPVHFTTPDELKTLVNDEKEKLNILKKKCQKMLIKKGSKMEGTFYTV